VKRFLMVAGLAVLMLAGGAGAAQAQKERTPKSWS